MFFGPNVPSIGAQELKGNEAGKNIIDIREPFETARGAIESAKKIPMGTLTSAPEKYLNKDQKYYIICASGGRSAQTCGFLTKQGYDVVNVKGGMGLYSL